MKKAIIETGIQTGSKLLDALKAVYPLTTFEIKVEEEEQTEESGPMIDLYWLDGPTTLDVEKITMEFMTMVDGDPRGYEWNGQLYKGAYCIESCRTVSTERQAIISARALELGVTDPTVFQADGFESDLVDEGKIPLTVTREIVEFSSEDESYAHSFVEYKSFTIFEYINGSKRWEFATGMCQLGGCLMNILAFDSLAEAFAKADELERSGKSFNENLICKDCEDSE